MRSAAISFAASTTRWLTGPRARRIVTATPRARSASAARTSTASPAASASRNASSVSRDGVSITSVGAAGGTTITGSTFTWMIVTSALNDAASAAQTPAARSLAGDPSTARTIRLKAISTSPLALDPDGHVLQVGRPEHDDLLVSFLRNAAEGVLQLQPLAMDHGARHPPPPVCVPDEAGL